ncbi:quinolinate synthase NadA [Caldisalinibacter kiritimatiensis]|uniref:Quinolinate synthase n=1 Tax=Caldisalinibacter kiritimatiensis TaxID=1304284 RepID=R1CU56_9FIRM|nr:quinolinate synthase NadA [Caldisalinibacter kiritimatiensis]EOD00214.1 Quinolinate synthetase [Caldisalinibacter kiritimatiensis]
MKKNKIIQDIEKLKKEKNAIILAHSYQIPEVQEVADIVGDSLALSKAATEVDNEVIVFCGVNFMAESAKILSPNKKVLLPIKSAGCPMADMVSAKRLRQYKKNNPDTTIVCYVNSSASVKAESDICCTSSNALKVVESIDSDKILFVPDRNLGNYVKNNVKNKQVELWPGFCPTHNNISLREALKIKEEHPEAEILVHPECSEKVIELADFVGSTSQIIKYANESNSKEFLIGTEMGVLHILRKQNPNKEFDLLYHNLLCPDMKKTRLEDVLNALMYEQHEINVEEDIRQRALIALNKMLEIS